MSVLKLRRDMVVEDDPATAKVAEIERPFPLRKLDVEKEAEDIVEGEIAVEAEADEHESEARPGKSFVQHVRFWFNAAFVVVVLGAYPTMVVAASDVGDRNLDRLVNRAEWAAPWAGGVATLLEDHFGEFGWAPDAAAWEPMARLTAKPAYQSAMAGALGDVIRLANTQAIESGQQDADLAAASRLVTENSTAIQLRAARDALVNHDRRLRRRDVATDFTAAQVGEQLALISAWGASSQVDIVKSASAIGGSPMDEEATRAVYAAKGRATVAWLVLASMRWPETAEATKARDAALNAWREIAEFHPLIVFNGDTDGSVFGNHAASMGFLVAQAQAATATFETIVKSAAARPVVSQPAPARAGSASSAP